MESPERRQQRLHISRIMHKVSNVAWIVMLLLAVILAIIGEPVAGVVVALITLGFWGFFYFLRRMTPSE